ncbi:MAG: hypothetical protein ABIP75_02475 [Pyrinomonadaceae bacterium]
MIRCGACGVDNADGTQFCVNCGSQLPSGAPTGAPPPPVYQTPPSYQPGAPSGYPPPGQQPMPVPQPIGPAEPMHPGIAALLSFLMPGLGLLFFPNKRNLGIYMLAGTIGGGVLLFGIYLIISFVTFGIGSILACCFLVIPLWNIFAALYTYDMAAKEIGGGKYPPLIFK